jgi:hypothetical protein
MQSTSFSNRDVIEGISSLALSRRKTKSSLAAESRPSETWPQMNECLHTTIQTTKFKPRHSNILFEFHSQSRCQMLGTKYDMQQKQELGFKARHSLGRQAIWAGGIPRNDGTDSTSTEYGGRECKHVRLVRPLPRLDRSKYSTHD